jgi:hypothetical protein
LITSSPEILFEGGNLYVLRRVWVWFHNQAAHGSLERACTLWKEFILRIKFLSMGATPPPCSPDVIFYTRSGINLRSFSEKEWGWLHRCVKRSDDRTKLDNTRLSHIIFSFRGMITPTRQGMVDGMNTHGEIVITPPPLVSAARQRHKFLLG